MPWLDAVAFLSGAAVLVLEILGTKVIAPFYGSTVYVWSSLIAVTLASLAAGYAWGGWAADRRAPSRWLQRALAGAGAWLALLPVVSRPVLIATSGLGVAAGAFASALVLFAPPLALLGAVAPLCIRLRTTQLGRVGREVGRVSAVSTLGGVLGACATGFVLVERFAVPGILAGLSVSLFGLAAACAVWSRGRLAAAAAAAAGAVVSAGLWAGRPAGAPETLLARETSFYGDVKVLQARGIRILDIDGISNTVVNAATLESTSEYIDALELLPHLRPRARRALLIGLGGGSLVGRYRRHFAVTTDVVEIDPKVERLARRYFGFEPSGAVFLEDGRIHLERSRERYDLIVLDAFNGDHHPAHLFSVEAFQAAAARMPREGLLALNVIGYAAAPRDGLRRSLERTLRAVFPEVRAFVANSRVDYRLGLVNVILLASRTPVELGGEPPKRSPGARRAWELAGAQQLAPAGSGEGVLLTDAFNPLESLGAPAFRELRLRLLGEPLHRASF